MVDQVFSSWWIIDVFLQYSLGQKENDGTIHD
jgi:hypothetical protein